MDIHRIRTRNTHNFRETVHRHKSPCQGLEAELAKLGYDTNVVRLDSEKHLQLNGRYIEIDTFDTTCPI